MLACFALACLPQVAVKPTHEFTAPVSAKFDKLGTSVAIDGDTAVLGAPEADLPGLAKVGAAHVYQRTAGAWSFVTTLVSPAPKSDDQFGYAVDIDADTIVVGAHGGSSTHVHVFERDLGGPGLWGLSTTFDGIDTAERFGRAVAVSGDLILASAPYANYATTTPPFWAHKQGYVSVFERNSGGWSQTRALFPSQSTQRFGWDIDLEGGRAVMGNHSEFNPLCFVFDRDAQSGDWSETKFNPIGPATGVSWIGSAVALSGDRFVIGQGEDLDELQSVGVAFVVELDSQGQWNQTRVIDGGSGATTAFGDALALEGDLLVVGARRDDPGGSMDEGSAFLFDLSQTGAPALAVGGDLTKNDQFGGAVAISGGTVLVGAKLHDHNGLKTGGAWAFETGPGPSTYCTAGTSASGCQAAVTLTGTADLSSPSGFLAQAGAGEGATFGQFFLGINGRQANPWGNGTSWMCVLPPVQRTPVLPKSGTAGQCDSLWSIDLNAYAAANPTKAPPAGIPVQGQLWYRDPQSTSNQSTSLSDAFEYTAFP